MCSVEAKVFGQPSDEPNNQTAAARCLVIRAKRLQAAIKNPLYLFMSQVQIAPAVSQPKSKTMYFNNQFFFSLSLSHFQEVTADES